MFLVLLDPDSSINKQKMKKHLHFYCFDPDPSINKQKNEEKP
jgi:hypothetical protein